MKKPLSYVCIVLISLAATASGGGTVALMPAAADSTLLKKAGTDLETQNSITPQTYRLTGIFNDPDFSINSTDNITVRVKDGKTFPVEIEESSLIKEFGSIVSVKLAFEISTEQFAVSRDLLRLHWGPDINADNKIVPSVVTPVSGQTAYMTFTWKTPEESSEDTSEDSFASIEVVAESGAEHYYLWYLLPMGLIFLLLTIRKIISQ